MRYRVANFVYDNPRALYSPRGKAFRELVSKYGVIEASKIWRTMPETRKPPYAKKHIYVGAEVGRNPCGRGRYRYWK